MIKPMSRRELLRRAAVFTVALPTLQMMVSGADSDSRVGPDAASAAEETYHPTANNLPIGPAGADPSKASFIDPTVEISGAERISIGPHVYVGPFARLLAGSSKITIGEATNVQDNVSITAQVQRSSEDQARVAALGFDGVEVGPRCILAHGATIKGPARLGIGGGAIEADPDEDQEVFLSFACEVDGAILEQNTGVAALARVGPGVILRSGFTVLPGKNVTTQAEADDPGLGKVRLVTEADVDFNEAVIEVNEAFAREYARLYAEGGSNFGGINYDAGGSTFNPTRNLPVTSASPESPRWPGVPTQAPEFRNRIIGAVQLSDSMEELDRVMGSRIALRADEGESFVIGHIKSMSDGVIFHALEDTAITVGANVSYGERVIVHGGGRRPLAGGFGDEPTVIEDDVTLKSQAVVFRSRIGRGATIGVKTAVVNSDIARDAVVPDRTIIVQDQVFGPVEW